MVDKLRLEVLLAAVDKVTGPLKSVAQGSKATAKAVGEAELALKNLQAQQRALAKFERERESLDGARQQLDMAKAAGANRTVVRQLTADYEKQLAVVKKLQTDMAARGWGNATVDQRQLADSIARTNTALDAQRQKLAKQRDVEERLHNLREKHSKDMVKLAAWGGASAGMAMAGKSLMRVGFGPVDEFMAHEDAMMGVQRQVQGARDAQGNLTEVYRTAEREIRSLSERIPQSTVQIAGMYTAAARMEVPTDKLATFVEMASEIATAFDATPDEIAESMGKIANNLKMPVTEIRGLADTINYLDDNAISKGSDIIGFLNRVGGVAGTVGITGENMAALGSTLLTSGETEETAGTGVKAIFTNFAAATKGTKKFQGAVHQIGMTPQQMQEGMSKDAVGTMLLVAEAIQKIPKKEQLGVMAELAGKEHVGRLAKLVTNTEELRRQIALANSEEAKGSMAREAAARNSALSAQLLMQKNRMFNALAIAGEPLKAAILDVLKAVNPWLTKLTEWMQKNPALVGGILKTVVVVGALMAALGTLGLAIVTVLGPLHLARFLLARTVLNMAAVRAAASGASPVLGMMGRAWAFVSGGVGRLLPLLLRFAGPLGLLITAGTLIYKYWEPLSAFFSGFGAGLMDGLAPAITSFKGVLAPLTPLLGVLGSYLQRAWNWFTSLFTPVSMTTAEMNKLSSVGQMLGAIFGSILTSLVTLPMRFFELGANIVMGIANGITSRIQAVRDSISMAAGDAVDWFKEKLGIRSPSRVFMELGGYVSEGAAQGISGGAGMVRSAALGMAAGSMVAMAPVMAGQGMGPGGFGPGGGIGGGAAISIVINAAPGMDPQAVARAVAAELDRRERDKASGRRSSMADQD